MTLYLKYRPQKLAELDLESVRESLVKIVKSGKIPHALLFSGPKGIGKTSAARILAKIINCEKRSANQVEPCNKCSSCDQIKKGASLDIIELDAASHRGIEDVRAIRDAVKLAPVSSKKKVYIIDEAHMLTTEAANALLKTLEEPPDHVMFILATTNPEKLIETIRSRTTSIPFKKARQEEIAGSLTKIIKGEKIKITDNVLDLISKASEGSFRDAAKILERLITEKIPLSYESVATFLYQKTDSGVNNLIEYLKKKDAVQALSEIEKIVANGSSVTGYIQKVLEKLRVSLLAKMGMGEDELEEYSKEDLISLIKLLLKAGRETEESIIEQLPLEIVVIKWCGPGKKEEKKDEGIGNFNKGEKKSGLKNFFEKTQKKLILGDLGSITDDIWKQVLVQVRVVNATVEALLRAAKPINFDGKTLTLGVFYKFHKERLEEIKNAKILEEVIGKVLNISARVICILTEPPQKPILEEKAEETNKFIDADSVTNKAETNSVLTESDSVLTEGEDEDIIKAAKEIFGN